MVVEAVDHQAADRAAVTAGRQGQTVPRACRGTIQFDDRRAGIASLGGRVQNYSIGDGRENRRERDRVRTGTGDIEYDGACPTRAVGIENRLPQGPGAIVVRIDDG